MQLLFNCVTCKRFNNKAISQKMADLPKQSLTFNLLSKLNAKQFLLTKCCFSETAFVLSFTVALFGRSFRLL